MKLKKINAQSAVEYLILATTITIALLIGFDQKRGFLTKARNLSEGMFNQSLRGIMGAPATTAARTRATNYP